MPAPVGHGRRGGLLLVLLGQPWCRLGHPFLVLHSGVRKGCAPGLSCTRCWWQFPALESWLSPEIWFSAAVHGRSLQAEPGSGRSAEVSDSRCSTTSPSCSSLLTGLWLLRTVGSWGDFKCCSSCRPLPVSMGCVPATCHLVPLMLSGLDFFIQPRQSPLCSPSTPSLG